MTRLISIILFSLFTADSTPAQSTNPAPLPQEVYIWQRSWNPSVTDALTNHASEFSRIVPLVAEVNWKKDQPTVIQVPIKYDLLAKAASSTGLALRIGPYSGSFATNAPAARFLADLASGLLSEAKAHGLNPSELQLDFDCAESKLDGYRAWVETIRARIAPTPLTFTALPVWLNQPSFIPLSRAADGFILQVHSLERPKKLDSLASFQLCNPSTAQPAVERAARLGVPFRVALPTYAYLIVFSHNGRFLGLSAEGPSRDWPDNVQTREVRSDPAAISTLVQTWLTNHPPTLRGIIWYRMPISLDTLNWSWPTFSAVKAGRIPHESLRVELARPKPGLLEITLVNDGEAVPSSRLAVEIRWQKNRLVAADGLRDFEVMDSGPSQVLFRQKSTRTAGRLMPGERQVIGWLRFNEEVEVQVEIKKL